jgi:hypothetical protein
MFNRFRQSGIARDPTRQRWLAVHRPDGLGPPKLHAIAGWRATTLERRHISCPLVRLERESRMLDRPWLVRRLARAVAQDIADIRISEY